MADVKPVTKRVFKVFWAWQDQKEERWLEQMTLEGWSLAHVAGASYTFERTEPREMIYCIDYQEVSGPAEEEYLQLCADMGWELVGRSLNWFYFRRPFGPGISLELYTDNASRIKRYRSQLRTMAIALAPMFLLALVVFPTPLRLADGWWMQVAAFVTITGLLALLYGIARVWAVVRQLESRPEQ